jgi:hypothetical protein
MCYRNINAFVKFSFICKFLKRIGLFLGRPEGKRPLERPSHRWENNNKINHQGVGWGGMDWIELPQDEDKWSALVSAVMNLWVL